MGKIKNGLVAFFKAIGGFFKRFGTAIGKGDPFVKMSPVLWGAGYIRRKQIIKGILVTAIEAAIVLYSVLVAPKYVSKFSTLGTIEQGEPKYNPVTMQNEFVANADNSFMILLISLITFVIWIATAAFLMINTIASYELQKKAEKGLHVNSFIEDVKELVNHKFHITLLFLPVLGILLFTIIPLLIMILVAFTNYSPGHLPPKNLFTWVGFDNFVKLFSSGGLTVTFGYTFVRVLSWTLVWALFATLTTYIGGILLSMLINNKKTKLPKMWRVLIVVTIAVPQFVSLLLVRQFFADNGIVNTICREIGLTELLRDAGLIKTAFIPFLSAPIWMHVMIILINIWVGVPYQMLIATGVLMNIPSEQLESARIDGANPRQIFWKITMPYMLFITGPTLVTDFIKNINNFNVIYLLTSAYKSADMKLASSSANEASLLVTWLFSLTQDDQRYNIASTIGIIVFLISAVVTLLAFNQMIKGDREEAFR